MNFKHENESQKIHSPNSYQVLKIVFFYHAMDFNQTIIKQLIIQSFQNTVEYWKNFIENIHVC